MKTKIKHIITLTSLLLVTLAASSCYLIIFIQPGYWQSLFHKLTDGKQVYAIAEYDSKYQWEETGTILTQALWLTSDYKNALENPPKTVNLYRKDRGDQKIYKYTDVKVSRFENNKYSKDVCPYIYTLENIAPLNYYIPQSVPEGTKIYTAKDNKDMVKFITTQDDFGNPTTTTTIYKNGLLIQETTSSEIIVVEY